MTERPADYLPFARPSITDREKQAVLDVLDSGWLTTGSVSKTFEERFAAVVGSRDAVALNSATAALHLALEAIGRRTRATRSSCRPGPSPPAPRSSPTAVRARSSSTSIASTLNATPEVGPRRRHRADQGRHRRPLRRPADRDRATGRGCSSRGGIAVVEDAAHSFPSRVGGPDGRYAGTFGAVGAYSFYATKTITTGEGGMLVTDDPAIADRARLMSLHGISRGPPGTATPPAARGTTRSRTPATSTT